MDFRALFPVFALMGALTGCITRDPAAVVEPPGSRSISVGATSACALGEASGAACWGNGYFNPQVVDGLAGVETLAPGADGGAYAVHADGSVSAIDPSFDGSIRVAGLSNVSVLSAGRARACAVHGDGTVTCWRVDGGSPQGVVDDLAEVVTIAVAPRRDEACAVMAAGDVRCLRWDDEDAEQLRIEPVAGLSDVVQVALGDGHACALQSTGDVHCWGEGRDGQIGDGALEDRETPSLAGVAGAVWIAAGDRHTCARLDDGTVRCWGYDGLGQRGDGQPDAEPDPEPSAPVGLTDVVDLALGGHSSCARTAGGVSCWGDNIDGQLGDGSRDPRSVPTHIDW